VSPTFLATLNASLNAASTVFLTAGYFFIRRKDVARHRFCMLTAFGISCVFLVSYLIHHARVGSVPFRGPEALRPVYLAVLVPHVILAASVPILAILTIRRALKGDFERHRRLARVTWPIWLYVSVSGVAVYWMLYRM
jgi:putative membrane protein